MIDRVTFLLNGEIKTLAGISPTATVLNFLRRELRLTGTKEGCAEGDCGACTVVVGELRGERVTYRAVNACIQFVPMLEGKALVTVEGLKGPAGALHPCQQALVDNHGSQCGFCTPGFVMSLYAAHVGEARPSHQRINDILAGNLCRCTGYGPIVQAADAMYAHGAPAWDVARRERERELLQRIAHRDTVAIEHAGQRFFSPATVGDLARLYRQHPDAVIVAGATDVGLWVTKQHRELATVIHIGRVAELQRIDESGGRLRIGAGVPYTDAEATIARHFPDFGELMRRLGAVQVRNAGTMGGNVANGSPIGDSPPALIALGAELVLRLGDARRRIPLESFFLAYGKQDRAPGEFVESIEVPLLDDPERLKCYKLTKRFDQDITAVCGCFNLRVQGGICVEARICFGGMAATPKRARAVEAALTGKPWTAATVEQALAAFERDYAPISDMRASAAYRMRAAKNLLLKYFRESSHPLAETRLVGRHAAFG